MKPAQKQAVTCCSTRAPSQRSILETVFPTAQEREVNVKLRDETKY